MLKIGAHITIAKGFTHASKVALRMGGNTFQFFSRNPRGSKSKAYDAKDVATFQLIRKKYKFAPIMAHTPYTMNLAGERESVYEFAKMVIREDIKRMDELGIEFINLHPGSHVGIGEQKGTEKIIEGLSQAITGDEHISVLLETMSGKGSEIGGKFYHLKRIIDGVGRQKQMGVCMDLCHVFAAGYDVVDHLDEVLDEFDRVIGIQYLKAIHLNDSVIPFGKHQDHHAPLGEGKIGLEAILRFMEHEIIRDLPFYLETPLDEEGHKQEIRNLRQMLNKRSEERTSQE